MISGRCWCCKGKAWQIGIQHFAVQGQLSTQCLAMGGRRCFAIYITLGLTTQLLTRTMDRSPLEKASWIAGIVSAVVAIWVMAFPSGQPKEDTPRGSPMSTAAPQSEPMPAPPQALTGPISAVPAASASSSQACTNPTAIATLRKQASLMSTYDARDAAYRPLVSDAICLNDLNLAVEIASLASTYARRDELYQRILDAAISTNNKELAEKLAGLMSTYASRDEARKKIMTALRGTTQ